jgi:glycosyltransferase involved in cell wall biosynthesis
MRVGLVCAHTSPATSSFAGVPGAHQHVTRVAAELTARGHDVRLYERQDDPALPATATEPAGYRLERAPEQSSSAAAPNRLVASVAAFGRWLADRWSSDWAPDVVHGHFWVGGLAAATAVRSTAIPVVQTFHSLAAEQQRHLGHAYTGPGERATLERALSRAVDLAVAQCSDEADELTRMGLPRASVAIVPSGVDTDVFTPEGERQPRTGRAPRILSVGLHPGHGQDDVIRAMRLVGEAELVVVGGPPAAELANHAEARRLHELARRAGVADRVRFVGGVAHEEMPSWYRSAEVVTCTPRSAQAEATALEAMACGVPVVGYERGGIAESVVNEVTGRLVPVGDVRALGVGLRRLLTDEAERFAYANAAVDRVRCRYTWDRAAAGLERVYERVLDQRRSAAAAGAASN